MSLVGYNKKRSFNQTPEPRGGKPSSGRLRFVVQKHHASRLHYDFRLEMDGVLKSWAIPKGPSTDPAVKRLAMMVEDHPYDYKDFEGIIPPGNYGAGTVIVWDEGTYEPIEAVDDRKKQERLLLKQLKSGSVKIRLNGKKLQGEFALVKTKGMDENAWLLIKHRDEYASEEDITEKDKSVISNKTLESVKKSAEIAETKITDNKTITRKSGKKAARELIQNQNNSGEAHSGEPSLEENKGAPSPATGTQVKTLLKKAKKQKFYTELAPMLATLVDAPFDNDDWEFEIKWDGYRALAFMNRGRAELKSRNNKSFNDRFYPIYEAIAHWKVKAVVDGEIVVVDSKGISNFALLQNWRSEADGELLYYVFDLLWLDGKDLTRLPLYERKALLSTIIPKEEGPIRIGYSLKGKGTDFFKAASELGLEGIIAKKSNSRYVPGDRTKNWLKIKIQQRQEVVVAGYTKNQDTPKAFSSLLLGAYSGKELVYVGKVGTGFKEKEQTEMLQLFKKLEMKKSPFAEIPEYNKPSRFRPSPPQAEVTWLKPELVCEITFTEITTDGVFRHPSFKGLREDKKATEVVLETKDSANEVVEKSTPEKDVSLVRPPKKTERKTLLNPKEETQVRKLNGAELKFTNLNKVFWKEGKITKRELINYYYQIAPYMLPYLKDRPMSLNRFPNGIDGKSFYQKNMSGKVPEWAKTFPYESDGERKNYLVGSNEASLLYMINLGCIDVNPWSSRTSSPDHPDWCILDLDPGKSTTFDQVIVTAQTIKKVLDSLQVEACCKTSGSTGIHIYIPLGANYTYDQSQLFAQWIATQVQQQLADFTSIERMINKRDGKLYIDYLQNRSSATLAAPYSVRPKPGATVSMPLHWEEVKKGLKMTDFTISNAVQRLQREGDLFAPVLGKGIDLAKILEKL
jgi:bifunctional non-homologous end joining protein LigD